MGFLDSVKSLFSGGDAGDSGYWVSVSPDGFLYVSVTVDEVDYDLASVPIVPRSAK